MFQGIILQWVLSYIASAITKAEQAIDWAALKSQLEAQLKAAVPSPEWVEQDLQVILDKAVDLAQGVCGAPGVVAKVISLVKDEDWSGVVSYLEALIMGQIQTPMTSSSLAYSAMVLAKAK